MAATKLIEHQPGVMPEIRAAGESVVYYLEMAGRPTAARLVLRCDENGDVWAALERTPRKAR